MLLQLLQKIREIWAVMEFIPIKGINPTQTCEGKRISPYIRSITLKKLPQKISGHFVEKFCLEITETGRLSCVTAIR